MIFYTERLENRVGLTLEPIVSCILKPATDLCFKECKAILLTLLGRLELRLWILRDCDGTVLTDWFMAIAVVVFVMRLVMTLLDVTLMVVDA